MTIVSSTVGAGAAVLEESKIKLWTANAFSDDKTGNFDHCTVSVPYKSKISLIFSLDKKDAWAMGMFKDSWNWKGDTDFIATINIEGKTKFSVVADATVVADDLIKLELPNADETFSNLRSGKLMRVSFPKERFDFRLDGTALALEWLQNCVKRYESYQPPKVIARKPTKPTIAAKPAEDDDDDNVIGLRSNSKSTVKPAIPSNPSKVKPPVVEPEEPPIEAEIPPPKIEEPTTPPKVIAKVDPPKVDVPKVDVPKADVPKVEAPTNDVPPVAELTPPTETPPAVVAPDTPNTRALDGKVAAKIFLPNLMASANRYDYTILDARSVPERAKKADLAFSSNGMIGVVYATDFPTAQAAANEILTYDSLACGGVFSSGTDPAKDGRVDVAHSFTECEVNGKSSMARYTTLLRRNGGYFIVGLLGDSGSQPPEQFQQIDASMFDAALKVSGKF